jgi:hypothetical protein
VKIEITKRKLMHIISKEPLAAGAFICYKKPNFPPTLVLDIDGFTPRKGVKVVSEGETP